MRGALMRRWTAQQHKELLSQVPDDSAAAYEYTRQGKGVVSRQLVRYWRAVFIENDGKLATADRGLAQSRVLIQPRPEDDFGDTGFIQGQHDCILVIPDIHAPYQHPDTLDFLTAVRDHFLPDAVVSLGDELDYHALSFHDSDPNLDAAGAELEKAKLFMHAMHSEFPRVLVCDSNHGSMVFRRAKAHGIPVQMLKKYRDVIFPDTGAPYWSWSFSWKLGTALGPVMFKHQSSNILTDAAHNGCNLVVGHSHGNFSVEYSASSDRLYWGGYAGCLIDKDSMAFAYGKHSLRKPMIGCMVILNGRPTLLPMVLKADGRWIGRL